MEEHDETSGPPGSQGSGLGGRMESGPDAGAGSGGAQDVDDLPREWITEGVGRDGPVGPQDSSVGDLDEPPEPEDGQSG